MNDSTFHKLLESINRINDDEQYTYIRKCIDLLKIKDIDVDPFSHRKKYSGNDFYIHKIVQYTESLLSGEQLRIFYSTLKDYYLSFCSNEGVKRNIIDSYLENGKVLDYRGKVNYKLYKKLTQVKDDEYVYSFITKYMDNIEFEELNELLCGLKTDYYKIEFLNKFWKKYEEEYKDDPENLFKLIISIQNDDLEEMYLKDYKNEIIECFKDVPYICSLNNNDKKLQFLLDKDNKIKDKLMVLDTIQDEKVLEKVFNESVDDIKICIIYKIKSQSRQIELLHRLNETISDDTKLKCNDVLTAVINGLSEENLLYVMDNLKNLKFDVEDLIEYVESEDVRLKILMTYPSKLLVKYVRNNQLISLDKIYENLDLFLQYEGVGNKDQVKQCIKYMYPLNNDILCKIEWPLLTDKYINMFGLDKLNLIGSYNTIESDILEMNEKQLLLLNKCLNEYLGKYNITDWNRICEKIIASIHFQKVDHKDITEIINNYDNIDMECLLYILLNGDEVGIKNEEDINNYFNLLEEKCNIQIKSDNLSLKRDAIFMKIFGLSDKASIMQGIRGEIKNGMQRLYYKFGKDISLIEDENIKGIFKFVEEVLNCQDPNLLDEIYEENKFGTRLDTFEFEALLKKEYMKLFNKTLLQLDNMQPLGDNMYDAGVDFCILATSIGAYVDNSPEDYKKDWNRASLSSPHFCTNYIRNDMLGTAPVPHVMYGFFEMADNSLVLAGPSDIYSSGDWLSSKAQEIEAYYGPDNMINKSSDSLPNYNEMDFNRIQNGKKKQPDYILVKKIDGVIDNLDEAKKASEQWGNLPIVVIDVNKCLENESRKVKYLVNHYMTNPTIDLLNMIKIKIKNNRVTSPNFESEIDLKQLEEMINIQDQSQVIK